MGWFSRKKSSETRTHNIGEKNRPPNPKTALSSPAGKWSSVRGRKPPTRIARAVRGAGSGASAWARAPVAKRTTPWKSNVSFKNPFAIKRPGGVIEKTVRKADGSSTTTRRTTFRKQRRLSGRGTTRVRPKAQLALGSRNVNQYGASQQRGVSVFENVNPMGQPDLIQKAYIPEPQQARPAEQLSRFSVRGADPQERKDIKSLRNRADYLRRRYGVNANVSSTETERVNPQQSQPLTQEQMALLQRKKSSLDFPSVL